MFIFSVKADKRKICVILAAILLVVTAAVVLTKVHNSKPTAECAGVRYTLSAATNEERVAFFGQFGWKVAAEPIEIKDVTIPATFNNVYTNYNNIQKDQGLDLTPYAGKTCKQWVYAVTNYPQNTDVRATILVVDNRVIGGDLSTAALDGFMTGFKGEQVSDDMLEQMLTSSAPSSAAPAASKAPASSKAPAASKAPASSKAPAASKAPVASKAPASSKAPAASKSPASAVQANPKASSAIPANAWPTD